MKTNTSREAGGIRSWVLSWLDSNELPWLLPRWWRGSEREREIWQLRQIARRRIRAELVARQGWSKTICQSVVWPGWAIVKAVRRVRANRARYQAAGQSLWLAALDLWYLQVAYNLSVGDQIHLCLDWPEKRARVRWCMVCRELQPLLGLTHLVARGRERIGRKREFFAFCREHALPTPAILSEGAKGQGLHRTPWPPRDLMFKPADLGQGEGVIMLRHDSGRWFDETGVAVASESVATWAEGRIGTEAWVVQVRLHNAASWRGFTTGALATCRVITARLHPGAEPQVLAAYARFPNESQFVDNLAAGGIGAAFNPRDGRLRRCTGKYSRAAEGGRHPRTGVQIADTILPGWMELLALAVSAHRAAGAWSSLGWDVALTDDGPVLIETNWQWAIPFDEPIGATVFPEVFKGLFGQKFERVREVDDVRWLTTEAAA